MKSIFKKIHISYYFWFLILISLLSGLFRDIIWLFIVLFIHELGHIFFSVVFNWKIERIDINIYGGLITYDDFIDKPFYEEFIISISGILFQSIFYLLILFLYNKSIIDSDIFYLVKNYHYAVFFFNLLPIIPLDGSKILFVFLNIFFSYKTAIKLLIINSFLTIIFSLYVIFNTSMKFEFSFISIFWFILYKLYEYIALSSYLFYRFLYERYISKKYYKKINIIHGYKLSKIKRQKNSIFIINNNCFTEEVILKKMFDYYI